MNATPDPPQIIDPDEIEDAGEQFQMTDEDYALYIVLSDLNDPIGSHNRADYIAQILAVKNLLERQKHHDDTLQQQMDKIEALIKKTGSERVIDEWGEHFYESIYQDAAHSMAAVGMLAPLIESFFLQSFYGLQRLLKNPTRRRGDQAARLPEEMDTSHPRWKWPEKKQWDCHFYSNKNGNPQKDLVRGIKEISTSIGLIRYMPTDLQSVLHALFSYRNKMFHHGFEWPPAQRQNFERQLADWSTDWFSKSTSGEKPWMFYLTGTYIEHCLATIDKSISGIGAFARIVDDH
jgi:hypothetical protein